MADIEKVQVGDELILRLKVQSVGSLEACCVTENGVMLYFLLSTLKEAAHDEASE